MKFYNQTILKWLKLLTLGLFIFYYCIKITIIFADYELKRLKLPGFWHTLRGHPLVINEKDGDISYLPFFEKNKKIWYYIRQQGDNF